MNNRNLGPHHNLFGNQVYRKFLIRYNQVNSQSAAAAIVKSVQD